MPQTSISPVPGALSLFLKSPDLGRVKTRLATTLNEQTALDIYVALVEHQLETLQPLRSSLVLSWADTPQSSSSEALREQWSRLTEPSDIQQRGENLGQRMFDTLEQQAVMCRATTPSGRTPRLLFGADIPMLSVDYVLRALIALEEGAEVVIGPTEDGGYGLIGLSGSYPELFDTSISWGTKKVFAQTEAIVRARGLQLEVLDLLWDVDYAADVARMQKEYPGVWERG